MRRAWLWATFFLVLIITGSSAISILSQRYLGLLSPLMSIPLGTLWALVCAWAAFKLVWRGLR